MSLREDRGAVTVEAAFAAMALVALLVALVSAVGLVVQQVECVDAAAAIARQYARADADGVAEARAHLPKGGSVSVSFTPTRVTVRVGVVAQVVPGSRLTVDLSAASTAVLEPGASG